MATAAYDFLDDRALRTDLDQPFLTASGVGWLPPVFVLGLHRSGTTFLYQLVADHFRMGVTELYHITHYQRLLWAEQHGRADGYRQALDAHLAGLGISDRGIDGFPVSAAGLEEYAFILRKFTGQWGMAPKSAAFFDTMLAKLSALQPGVEALLLKNPLDLGAIDQLADRYPEARFLLIRRDPVRVLNSQFRNSFLYRKQPEPFLDLLLAGVPLWRFNFRLMPWLNRLIPDGLYQQLLVHGLRRSIAGQLARHYAVLPRVAPHRVLELTYEDLIKDPAPSMRRVGEFLGLAQRSAHSAIASTPRLEPLLPAVAAVADAFRAELAAFPDARLTADAHSVPRPMQELSRS